MTPPRTSGRPRRQKGATIERISFDPRKRREFLNGFSTRKKERKLEAQRAKIDKARVEKAAIRKERRRTMLAEVGSIRRAADELAAGSRKAPGKESSETARSKNQTRAPAIDAQGEGEVDSVPASPPQKVMSFDGQVAAPGECAEPWRARCTVTTSYGLPQA
eukprot:GHVT01028300.1.p1 GENE.GHVT01028300.1~~GHVT01028300.1.p1  ORF type:complete len:162 (-),score=28.26 GHVT01028300.1:300-785(-)